MIHERGYWCGEDVASAHVFDESLSIALVDFFKKEKVETIVDFGCGLGDYVKSFLCNQIDCEGYDGNPDTYKISQGVAHTLDLSEPFFLEKKFDWVVSLEVGEHLPKEFESVFLDNLDRHSTKGIVLSWAVKGQDGYGHFNEQNNDYIKARMQEKGYYNDLNAEKELRCRACVPWFKNTIMVFRKM